MVENSMSCFLCGHFLLLDNRCFCTYNAKNGGDIEELLEWNEGSCKRHTREQVRTVESDVSA